MMVKDGLWISLSLAFLIFVAISGAIAPDLGSQLHVNLMLVLAFIVVLIVLRMITIFRKYQKTNLTFVAPGLDKRLL